MWAPKRATFEKFSVGDVVKVVDVPYEACVFGWDGVMSRYCGMEATITAAGYDYSYEAERYRIDLDDGRFVWCGGCFESACAELNESDEDVMTLFSA